MIMRTQSMFVIGLPLTRGPSLPLVWMVGLSSTKCPRKSRWKFWILILANSLDGNVTFWFYNVTLKRYRTILAILVSCFVFNTHNNIVYEFLKYFVGSKSYILMMECKPSFIWIKMNNVIRLSEVIFSAHAPSILLSC